MSDDAKEVPMPPGVELPEDLGPQYEMFSKGHDFLMRHLMPGSPENKGRLVKRVTLEVEYFDECVMLCGSRDLDAAEPFVISKATKRGDG